jgi:hypothetical protein
MQVVAPWLFVVAVYGTLVMPVVLPIVAWSGRQGARGRRLLAASGGWIAVCTLAGVLRLFTDDGYYSPDHVTFWSATTGEARHGVVLLLAASAAASAALLAYRVGRAPRLLTPAFVVVSGGLLLAAAEGWSGGTFRVATLALIAAAMVGGAVLAARGRESAATLFALVGGGFVTTLVMLTVEIGLGLH